MSSLYLIFKNGQPTKKDPRDFKLKNESDKITSVFTTFVTFNIKAKSKEAKNSGLEHEPALLALDYHVKRLVENAKELNLLNTAVVEHRPNSIEQAVFSSLKVVFDKSPSATARYKTRLILSENCLEIMIEPLVPNWPAGKSIKALCTQCERTNPQYKTTNFSRNAAANTHAKARGFNEALLVDSNGYVTEGAYSNFFWFTDKDILYTPRNKVLPGVTRRIVGEIAKVREKNITEKELLEQTEEVFITQSSTGITPVVQINDKIVGGGKPGENTLRLIEKFADYLEINAKTIF